MKMNTRLMLTAAIAFSVSFVSCKKTDRNPDNNTDLAIQSDDQSRVATSTDEIYNDANDIIGSYTAVNGRPGSVSSIPCNATAVLDSTVADRRITVTYNGANCYGTRNRTGVVVLSIPITQRWADQGAVLTIEAQNFKVTRLSDSKSITINGRTMITNVTGGRIINLASSGAIIHDISAVGVSITFDDGSQRVWSIAKKRTFTYDNGIVVTTIGTHTENGITNISEWGTNRFGNQFTASITSPMIIREDCDFRLVNGQITHQGALGNVVATFGLNADGNATSCPGTTGFYYFKAVWTGLGGVVRTVIYPY